MVTDPEVLRSRIVRRTECRTRRARPPHRIGTLRSSTIDDTSFRSDRRGTHDPGSKGPTGAPPVDPILKAVTTIDGAGTTPIPQRDALCRMAIEHFGRFGFGETMLEMSIATDTDVETLTDFFGSIEGMRAACDDYLQATVAAAKTQALVSPNPTSWAAQIADIEEYVPMMRYMVRSLEDPGVAGKALLQKMTDSAEQYLETAVEAGTVRQTRDPKGRAHLLALFGAGGFLLYRRMHATPDDMAAVLRGYARELLFPALELYTYGLMTDDSMFHALTEHATV